MKNLMMLRMTTLLTLSLLFTFPTSSRADAIYNSISLADLNIVGVSSSAGLLGSIPDNLLITGNAVVLDEDSIIDGNAFADQFASALAFGDPIGLGLNEGLSLQTIATGEATLGTAASFAFTLGTLAINNLSLTETFSVDFITDFSYLVDARVGNSNLGFATAVSEIILESDLIGSVLDLTVFSDSDLDGGLFTDNAVLPFSIVLEPGDSDNVSLTVNAAGIATAAAPVPEPSTLTLFAIGLIGTALFQLRQKHTKANLSNHTIYSKR